MLADGGGEERDGRAQWREHRRCVQGSWRARGAGAEGGPWLDGGGPHLQGEQFGCFPEGSREPQKVFEWCTCSVKNGPFLSPPLRFLAHLHIHRD